MKQMLVLIAMIGLGILLFQLIAGPDDSIITALGESWQEELSVRQNSN